MAGNHQAPVRTELEVVNKAMIGTDRAPTSNSSLTEEPEPGLNFPRIFKFPFSDPSMRMRSNIPEHRS